MEKELIYQFAGERGAYCYATPSLPEDLEILPKENIREDKTRGLGFNQRRNDLKFTRVKRPVRKIYDTAYFSPEEFDMFLKEAEKIIRNLIPKLVPLEDEVPM